MSSPSARKHAGSPSSGPSVPEPSFAERARTLLYLGRVGGLSTNSLKQPGFPFGSVMPYGLDDHGRPIFLISTMAMHTQNLRSDPRASLLVTQSDSGGDVLGASRVTLMGDIRPVDEEEVVEARQLYLASYESSKYWVDFDDFSFYRMNVIDVYYVGGFGVMGWVDAVEYGHAKPDPLADAGAGIVQHMNADHKDALVTLACVFAGIEAQEAAMTSVDRLGFHLRAKTKDGMRGARIAFLREGPGFSGDEEGDGRDGSASAASMTVAVQTRFAQAISGDSNEFSSDRERDGARLGTERLCEYAHAFAREIPL